MIGMTLSSRTIDSPVGPLRLVASGAGLVAILWVEDRPGRVRLATLAEDPNHAILDDTTRQLGEYFSGRRTMFTVPLDLRGSSFQQKVWEALLAIPFGETRSYKQLAESIGQPRGTQAVGGANARNPVSIIVPCHRVIGSSGKLTGYAGGMEAKAHLLALEGRGTEFSLTSG